MDRTRPLNTVGELVAWLGAWPQGEWAGTIAVYDDECHVHDYFLQAHGGRPDPDHAYEAWLATAEAYDCMADAIQDRTVKGLGNPGMIPLSFHRFFRYASDAFTQRHGFRVRETSGMQYVEYDPDPYWDPDLYTYDVDSVEFQDACKAKACQLLNALHAMDGPLAERTARLLHDHVPYTATPGAREAAILWLRLWLGGMDAHDAALAAGVELLGGRLGNR